MLQSSKVDDGFGENQRCLRTKYKIPADIMPAGTNHKHIRGTTLITSQADKLLASIKAFADNGASRTLLLMLPEARVLSEAPE